MYNAVLGEFLARSRAVKADPAWHAARDLPRRSTKDQVARRAAFRSVEAAHGFTADAAQSFASSLRKSWVREHLPAQETQNLGARAFDAIRRHPIGEGQVSFDLGPSQIAVAVQSTDGSWSGWVEPLAGAIRLDTMRLRRTQRHLDRQHRAASPACFDKDGVHTTGPCGWQRSAAAQRTVIRVAELHRRLAGHRKSLHGALANRLLSYGADIACERLDYVLWQKNFPRSVRDRAPGLLIDMLRRKAESAGGQQLYEYNPRTTALSQTCLCGNRKKKPLSQRVHRCECGIREDRDLFSAYLGLHVRTEVDGVDRLDLPSARQGWGHHHDVDESPKSGRSASARKRRGRRRPPSRRSVARIKARRNAKAVMRQSRSARTSTTRPPTAIAA